jgi:hypothetical protein
MRGGAGTGPGRECAALMSDFRAGESFDMVGELLCMTRKDLCATVNCDQEQV